MNQVLAKIFHKLQTTNASNEIRSLAPTYLIPKHKSIQQLSISTIFETSQDFDDKPSCDQVYIVSIVSREQNKYTVYCELVYSQHITDF